MFTSFHNNELVFQHPSERAMIHTDSLPTDSVPFTVSFLVRAKDIHRGRCRRDHRIRTFPHRPVSDHGQHRGECSLEIIWVSKANSLLYTQSLPLVSSSGLSMRGGVAKGAGIQWNNFHLPLAGVRLWANECLCSMFRRFSTHLKNGLN